MGATISCTVSGGGIPAPSMLYGKVCSECWTVGFGKRVEVVEILWQECVCMGNDKFPNPTKCPTSNTGLRSKRRHKGLSVPGDDQRHFENNTVASRMSCYGNSGGQGYSLQQLHGEHAGRGAILLLVIGMRYDNPRTELWRKTARSCEKAPKPELAVKAVTPTWMKRRWVLILILQNPKFPIPPQNLNPMNKPRTLYVPEEASSSPERTP